MLYYLIQLNPGRDITLHVSANNPAMVCPRRASYGSRSNMNIPFSCCIINLASKPRSSSLVSTKITLARNLALQRTRFAYACVSSLLVLYLSNICGKCYTCQSPKSRSLRVTCFQLRFLLVYLGQLFLRQRRFRTSPCHRCPCCCLEVLQPLSSLGPFKKPDVTRKDID